jgi:hypothetical protein
MVISGIFHVGRVPAAEGIRDLLEARQAIRHISAPIVTTETNVR